MNDASRPLAPVRDVFATLAERWREHASTLRSYGAEPQAIAIERAADELDDARRAAADRALTLEEAACESGFSRDHLRHLVAAGSIPNAGRRGSPRVRAGDLPRKPAASPSKRYDVDADALNLTRRKA